MARDSAAERLEPLLQGGIRLGSVNPEGFRQAAALLEDRALGLPVGVGPLPGAPLHGRGLRRASFGGRMGPSAEAPGLLPALT
jgi:hypothetical protein